MEAARILVCLDGTRSAEAVLPLVTALADHTNQRLMLLGVAESGQPIARLEELEAYLICTERSLREAGVEAATALMTGDPATEILRAATALNTSLIAMASRAPCELVRWAAGSVAERVQCSSLRPVLLVKRPDLDELVPTTVRRILVPLDGSELAESALGYAVPLAAALDAWLLLARVVPEYAAYAPGHQRLPDGPAIQRRQAEQAEHYLAGKAMTLPASLACERQVLRGNASRELVTLAQATDVDLVVMASHGRTGLSRAIHGSAAADLLCAGLPTLIVPQAAAVSGTVVDGAGSKVPAIRW